jgi:copper chaperone CopZ
MEVSGWHCKGCAGKTESALTKVNGVKSAKASLDKGLVVVTYDDSTAKKSDMEDAVKKQNYKIVGWK